MTEDEWRRENEIYKKLHAREQARHAEFFWNILFSLALAALLLALRLIL